MSRPPHDHRAVGLQIDGVQRAAILGRHCPRGFPIPSMYWYHTFISCSGGKTVVESFVSASPSLGASVVVTLTGVGATVLLSWSVSVVVTRSFHAEPVEPPRRSSGRVRGPETRHGVRSRRQQPHLPSPRLQEGCAVAQWRRQRALAQLEQRPPHQACDATRRQLVGLAMPNLHVATPAHNQPDGTSLISRIAHKFAIVALVAVMLAGCSIDPEPMWWLRVLQTEAAADKSDCLGQKNGKPFRSA